MNSYYYDSTSLSSLISSLKNQINDYNTIINNITTLKTTIENSNEWIQDTIKRPFIAKCDEYLTFYTGFMSKLEAYIAYLENKNKSMNSLEEAYS